MAKIKDEIYPFKGLGDSDSKTRLRIWKIQSGDSDQRYVVMFTELPDNEGTSVTNYSDRLATEIVNNVLKIKNPKNVIFIEHYPEIDLYAKYDTYKESFDLIAYEYDSMLNAFTNPTWKRVPREMVDKVICGEW